MGWWEGHHPSPIAYPGAVLREDLFAREVEEELAAVDILHHKAEQVLAHKRAAQASQERVARRLEHAAFGHGVLHLVLVDVKWWREGGRW